MLELLELELLLERLELEPHELVLLLGLLEAAGLLPHPDDEVAGFDVDEGAPQVLVLTGAVLLGEEEGEPHTETFDAPEEGWIGTEIFPSEVLFVPPRGTIPLLSTPAPMGFTASTVVRLCAILVPQPGVFTGCATVGVCTAAFAQPVGAGAVVGSCTIVGAP